MSNPIFLVFFILAMLLVAWNFRRVRRIQQEYRYEGEFRGPSYVCALGGADSEGWVNCKAGASSDALFPMAGPSPKASFLPWKHRHRFRAVYPTDLRIPWVELECTAGRVFLKDVIWFKNDETKFYVYVPRDVGEKLLKDAGREIPL